MNGTFFAVCCVFLGGGLGSVCRYAVGRLFVLRCAVGFPWGTLAVNVVGCLLIGFLSVFLLRRDADSARLFLVTGFCGGFTTFSTFSNELCQLFRESACSMALLYALASLLGGIVMCFAGAWLAWRLL